jgi:mRNA interferase MazF
MAYRRGTIVLVPFPFTDLSQRKARPAVVLSPEHINTRSPDVILAAISSTTPHAPNDLELVLYKTDPLFKATGLRVNSVVKAQKLVTIQQSLIHTTLGQLADPWLHELDLRVMRALGLRNT